MAFKANAAFCLLKLKAEFIDADRAIVAMSKQIMITAVTEDVHFILLFFTMLF